MMRDEGEARVTTAATPDSTGDDDERRRAFRRKLPFGRAAVLMVGERAHIVGVADVSVTGAFLTTRAPVSAGERHVLKLLLMPERVELSVQAKIVRVAQAEGESRHHPRGVAVHFLEVDEASQHRLEVFVAREPTSRPF
jgi:Tfp pilus assembly protein PilZ